MTKIVLCSHCFQNRGLALGAERIGTKNGTDCPTCGSKNGAALSRDDVAKLAHSFFVWGTLNRCEYGAAPIVQFNQHQQTSIEVTPWLEHDIRLIESAISVGFFYYGPPLWMIGEVEPLKLLKNPRKRQSVIEKIIAEYPNRTLSSDLEFYRLRINPSKSDDLNQYDSTPINLAGNGRLDSKNFPVMYGSQDLEVCVHECRVSAEDDIFFATISPTKELNLLDLTELLREDGVTTFESLDMAVHMLFLAGKHSYQIAREIALGVHNAGFDGIIYPSYFSLLRTGGMPFETVYGISHRRMEQLSNYEKSKIIPNLALFGRPIEQGSVEVKCINKLILSRVEYNFMFGPVGC